MFTIMVVVLFILLGLLAFTATSHFIAGLNQPRVTAMVLVRRALRQDKHAEDIKDYAVLFGVDNSIEGINIEKLLEAGSQLTITLGKDRVRELAEKVRNKTYHPEQLMKSKSRTCVSHKIARLIREYVGHPELIQILGVHIKGGSMNDEEGLLNRCQAVQVA